MRDGVWSELPLEDAAGAGERNGVLRLGGAEEAHRGGAPAGGHRLRRASLRCGRCEQM